MAQATREVGSKQQRSRRHHYLPVFYQRRFTGRDGLVWMSDLETRSGKRLPPKAALAVEDFNTVETEDGPSDAIERGLAEIDNAAATALRRIDEGFWPAFGEVRGALSMLMAFQLTRGPRFRDQMDHLSNQVAGLMMKAHAARPEGVRRRLVDELGREPTENEVGERIDMLENFDQRFRVSNTRQSHVTTMVDVRQSGEIAEILFRRAWSLEASDSLDFVTCDDPVTLWLAEPSFWDGVGVKTADEIRFPLSPRHCLVMHHPWVPVADWIDVDPARVLQVNASVIANAHRFVLSKETTAAPTAGPTRRRPEVEQLSGPPLAGVRKRPQSTRGDRRA